MTFVIEDNVPMPMGWHALSKYPLEKLSAGQSFFVASEDIKKTRSNMNNAVNRHSKRTGNKFAIRKVDGGLRCWRVS